MHPPTAFAQQAVNSYFRKMGRSIQEAQRDAVRAERGIWEKERLENASLRLGRTLAANAGLAEQFEDMEEVFGAGFFFSLPFLSFLGVYVWCAATSCVSQ